MADDVTESRRIQLPYMLVVAGLMATVVGLTWPLLVPDDAFWTAEQAQSYAQAATDAHTASIPHDADHAGHTHEPGAGPDLESAKAKLAALEDQLDTARTMRNYTGHFIAGLGVVCSLAGVILLRVRG